MLNIEKFAESIRNNLEIIKKKSLNPIIENIRANSYKSSRVYTDYGEDSASLKENDKLILFTTDGLRSEFVQNFPFGAGFSAIMISADDIYACGGYPLAASLVVNYNTADVGKLLFKGICEGSRKFKIPIIRGHTNPNSKIYSLAISMIGEIKRGDYISAGNAQFEDDVLLITDFDGEPGKANKFYWDTATFKTSEEILFVRKSMNEIATAHLLNSSKDISNGGIFGTIYQLLSYSNMGADVDIDSILIPDKLKKLNYTIFDYAKMYLTTSFISTCKNSNTESVIKLFKRYNLKAIKIGRIIKKHILKIHNDKEEIVLFDL